MAKIIVSSRAIGDSDNSVITYLKRVMNEVIEETRYEVQSLKYFLDDPQNLIMIATWEGNKIRIEIPYNELYFDENKFDLDVAFCSNSVVAGIEEWLAENNL